MATSRSAAPSTLWSIPRSASATPPSRPWPTSRARFSVPVTRPRQAAPSAAWQLPASIRGCTLYRNAAGQAGGGFAFANLAGPLTIENTIIACCESGGAIYSDNCNLRVLCSDLCNNTGGDWVDCIADQYGVNGNFSADPRFCDVLDDDFTLEGHSPCLPGEHPHGYDCGLIGALGYGCGDPTASVPTTWGAVKAQHSK